MIGSKRSILQITKIENDNTNLNENELYYNDRYIFTKNNGKKLLYSFQFDNLISEINKDSNTNFNEIKNTEIRDQSF